MRRLLLPLLVLLPWQLAQAYLFSSSTVTISENDDTDGIGNILDRQLDTHPTASSQASSSKEQMNSSMEGAAEAKIDPAKHLFKVGTRVYMSTNGDSDPPAGQSSRRDTYFSVQTVADQRDRLTITTAKPHTNVTVRMVFSFFASAPDVDGMNASLLASAYASLLPVKEADGSEALVGYNASYDKTGRKSGDDFFDQEDGMNTIQVNLPLKALNSSGTSVEVQASVGLSGIVYAYYSGQATGAFLDPANAGVGLFFKEFTISDAAGPIKDAKVVSSSGFDYFSRPDFLHRFPDSPDSYSGNLTPLRLQDTSALGIFEGKFSASKGADDATLTFSLRVDGSNFSAKAKVSDLGPMKFGSGEATTLALHRKNKPDLVLALSFDQTDGKYSFDGTVTEMGGADRAWAIAAGHAIYTARKNPVAPFINLPSGVAGKYTALFRPKTPADQGLDAALYPQGTGWAHVTVAASGRVTMVGQLADGAKFSAGGSMLEGLRWPCVGSLYGGRGSVGGFVSFVPDASSDFSATDLRWDRPAGYPKASSLLYPMGWPTGLKVDLAGSKFATPATAAKVSVLPGLGVVDSANGNALFAFTAGGLTPAPLNKAVNIDPKNKVTVVSTGVDKLTASLSATTGGLSGKFIHNASGVSQSYSGVVFQKTKTAAGYFVTPTASGGVALAPAP